MKLSRVHKLCLALTLMWSYKAFAMDIIANKIEVSSPISLALFDETESEAITRASNDFKELLPYYCKSSVGKVLDVKVLKRYPQAEDPSQDMDYLVVEVEYECLAK